MFTRSFGLVMRRPSASSEILKLPATLSVELPLRDVNHSIQ
jgi:hypothetical protein